MSHGLAADLVDPPLVPGSPEWCSVVTASKTAAILGLSPWQSRFTTYYQLAGMLPRDEQTVQQARGHHLEAAVANWFAEEQGVTLRPGRCWRSRRYPWMVASPDRLVVAHRTGRKPVALCEVKTSASYDGWGRDGTDEVPIYYKVQVLFQLDTLGLQTGYVAALLPNLSLRAYIIRFDAEEAAFIRKEVLDFLDTLPGGPNETPPDIDSHDSTYSTVRKLHPEIEPALDVEIDPEFALRFTDCIRTAKASEAASQQVKAELLQTMGSARRAVLPRADRDPLVIATRDSRSGGTPFITVPRRLPTPEELLA